MRRIPGRVNPFSNHARASAARGRLTRQRRPLLEPLESRKLLASFQGLGFSGAAAISSDGTTVVGGSTIWTQATGPQSLGTQPNIGADGVSANGSVVTGGIYVSGQEEMFLWTSSTGVVLEGAVNAPKAEIDEGNVAGISGDGTVVVGTYSSAPPGANSAFRWTASTGFQLLPHVPNGGYSGRGRAVSADGNVIVGGEYVDTNGGIYYYPSRWSASTGMVALTNSTGTLYQGESEAASSDGSVVVGEIDVAPNQEGEAFLWTNAGGTASMTTLGLLPGAVSSEATAVSADGSIVVGTSISSNGSQPFIWDAADGMRSLQSVLSADPTAATELAGWTLQGVTGISANGQTIVGFGINPQGQSEAWIANLTPPDTWTGAGATDLWSDGNNWQGGVAPTAGSDLVFPSGALQQTNVDDLGFTFNSITTSGTYSFSGQPLTTGSMTVSQGSLELDSPTTVTGTLSVPDNTTLTVGDGTAQTSLTEGANGTLDDEGNLTVTAAASLADSNSLTVGSNGTLDDEGTLTVAANATLTDNNSVTVASNAYLDDEGTLTVAANASLTETASSADPPNLTFTAPNVATPANVLLNNGNYGVPDTLQLWPVNINLVNEVLTAQGYTSAYGWSTGGFVPLANNAVFNVANGTFVGYNLNGYSLQLNPTSGPNALKEDMCVTLNIGATTAPTAGPGQTVTEHWLQILNEDQPYQTKNGPFGYTLPNTAGYWQIDNGDQVENGANYAASGGVSNSPFTDVYATTKVAGSPFLIGDEPNTITTGNPGQYLHFYDIPVWDLVSGNANTIYLGNDGFTWGFTVKAAVGINIGATGTMSDLGSVSVGVNSALFDYGNLSIGTTGTETILGLVEIEAGATVDDLGSIIVAASGTLSDQDAITVEVGGTLSVFGNLTEGAGGAQEVFGTLVIEPAGSLDILGSVTIEPGATYVPLGTVTVEPDGVLNLPPSTPLGLSLTSVPADTVGTAYTQTITATGGTGSTMVAYQVTSSTTPAALGLTFTVSTNGSSLIISGTPTASGIINFEVAATDAANDSVLQTYTLTINPNNVTNQVSVRSSGLVYNRATQLFGGTITITNTGTTSLIGTLQFELTGLPAGVTWANANGIAADGNPFITINLPNGILAPGQSFTFSVYFKNPSLISFVYGFLLLDEDASS